uniref:dnaJ homolog subfamily C member 4 n=1 Tax=Ciona intestinalis TaxID=7719 RepID=UPI000180B912|nr:dnaJ homolog subfamily C member 4 [Ciona intestinalis]|eukprot:XP_009861607.1 dnaJ homolog subfamily C member 4 [Ciona intestinalis]
MYKIHGCLRIQFNRGVVEKLLSTTSIIRNHYAVLGVHEGASVEEIKECYIKKCKELHPDKHHGDPAMHEKIVKINEAYRVLIDQKSRTEYNYGRNPKGSSFNPDYDMVRITSATNMLGRNTKKCLKERRRMY